MNYPIKELESPLPYVKAYMFGRCRVIVGEEPGVGWHMSISHHKQNPTWKEIRDARYHFIPDEITMAMFFPPKSEYVNIHEFCFHLFESKEGTKRHDP